MRRASVPFEKNAQVAETQPTREVKAVAMKAQWHFMGTLPPDASSSCPPHPPRSVLATSVAAMRRSVRIDITRH